MSGSGKSKDKDGFIRKPEYPGGREALEAFVKKNLVYPADALKHKVEGTVYVSYRVEHDGKVGEIQVLKGLGHGCDEEAKRLVGLLGFSPQKNRGSRVSVKRKIKIRFRLPKEKKSKSPSAQKSGAGGFRYSFKEKGQAEGSGEVYSYSLNLKKSRKPEKD